MNGSVRSSAGLVWRHQRILWWIFAVNLVLAYLGSLPARAVLHSVLDHSLESAKLVTGFDVGAFSALLMQPEVNSNILVPSVLSSAVVFFFYLLLIDGGIYSVYLEDRKLNRGEFFQSAGLYFWRMLRLALYSLPFFAIAIGVNGGIAFLSGKLSTEAPQETLGFWVGVGGRVIFLLLALFVRAWFDLAQARVVLDNERKVLRTVGRSWKLLVHSGGLYLRYLGIALTGIVVFSAGIALWVYVPHHDTIGSFVVLEAVTVFLLATRLWMKATSARWTALLPSLAVPVTAPIDTPPVPAGASAVEEPNAPRGEEPSTLE
jgi:hypothetical protein